jgi:multiple sugar transport system permease protein
VGLLWGRRMSVVQASGGQQQIYLATMRSWKRRRLAHRVLEAFVGYLLLSAVGAAFLIPFVRMATTSLMPIDQILQVPLSWIPRKFIWSNYPKAIEYFPFFLFLRNTMIICVFNVIALEVSSALVAYGLSRIRWPGREVLFAVLIGTMLIPYHVTLIPTFLIFKWLGWLDTLKPLTLPNLTASAFYVFLFRQFFLTIPNDLSEIAEIDGAGDLRILLDVILPLSKPALAAVAVFTLLGSWNDFLWPLLVLSSEEKYTLSLGLYRYIGRYSAQWGLLMAACTMVTVPVILLFLAAQRYFVEGITLTGIKG